MSQRLISDIKKQENCFKIHQLYWCPTRFPWQMIFVQFNSNTTGATSGTGSTNLSGPPEFTHGIQWDRSLFVLFSILFWPLCCLYFFDLRILIIPLVSSTSSYADRGKTDDYQLGKENYSLKPSKECAQKLIIFFHYNEGVYFREQYLNNSTYLNIAHSDHGSCLQRMSECVSE